MKRKYKQQLLKLGYDICDKTVFNFVLDSRLSLFQGSLTTGIDSNTRYFRVGTSGFKSLTSEQQFTAALVCLHHEQQHMCQFFDMQDGKADDLTCYSFLSCHNNEDFYRDNYKNVLYEIDAEHYGVIDTWQYLIEHGSESYAWQSIKDYIDIKLSQGDVRYVNRGFENCRTIEDVDDNFDRIYEGAKSAECDLLAIKRSLNSIVDPERVDFSDQLAYKLLYENKDAGDIMQLLPSGLEQIKFMASYVLQEHPDYRLFFADSDIMSLRYVSYVKAYDDLSRRDDFGHMRMADKRDAYMESLSSYNHNDSFLSDAFESIENAHGDAAIEQHIGSG